MLISTLGICIGWLTHVSLTDAKPLATRQLTATESATAADSQITNIVTISEGEFRQKAILDCMAAGGKPLWKPPRSQLGNLSFTFDHTLDNGPVYDDVIFDPTAAMNPPEYKWKGGAWEPAKRDETTMQKVDLAHGAILASLVAVVKMGRQFMTWLPQELTPDNAPQAASWCASKDLTINLKKPGDEWKFAPVATFYPSTSPSLNDATATGWYWPHYYHNAVTFALPMDDNVKSNIDETVLYAEKVLALLTGAETELGLTGVPGKSDANVELRNAMLDRIDHRPVLVAVNKDHPMTGIWPVIHRTTDKLVLYDYNTGQRPELSIHDVYVAISIKGKWADMFKDGKLMEW